MALLGILLLDESDGHHNVHVIKPICIELTSINDLAPFMLKKTRVSTSCPPKTSEPSIYSKTKETFEILIAQRDKGL